MKVLVITQIFPNRMHPEQATYNRHEMRQLSKLCSLKVIAPIPWFPLVGRLGNDPKYSQIPKHDTIDGMEIFHPKFPVIPKIGRSLTGIFFFLSVLGLVIRIHRAFKFDVIFTTWAYPDSFASVLISKLFGKPVLTKVLGSDINQMTKNRVRRKMIIYALKQAGKVISVSNALKLKMLELGVPESKIMVILNGVDKNSFRSMDKIQIRRDLGLPIDQKIILFVGHLVQVKGLNFLLDAFHSIKNNGHPDNTLLVLVGDGILRKGLDKQAKELGLEEFVRFAGAKSHDEIPFWINTCDLLCLPSLNEGCPNVVLEAQACGKPVVASKVGGIPEIINDNTGILVTPGDSANLANALVTVLEKKWESQALSDSRHDWKNVAQRTMKELEALI